MKMSLKLALVALCFAFVSAGSAHATFYGGHSYSIKKWIKNYQPKVNDPWCEEPEEPKDDCEDDKHKDEDCPVVPTPAALPAGLIALAAMGMRRRREA